MFTGIIEGLGTVLDVQDIDRSMKVDLSTQILDLTLGESVAVNGVCLTVAETRPHGEACFFVSPETLKRTNLGHLKKQSVVNLERALTLQTRLSGHLVQGHVDGQGSLLSVTPISEAYALEFIVPADVSKYCVEKGSISLNGVSLTINSVSSVPGAKESSLIGITIIPHTWTHTNLSLLKPKQTVSQLLPSEAIPALTQSGYDLVNIEVDILSKYVERLCRHHSHLNS